MREKVKLWGSVKGLEQKVQPEELKWYNVKGDQRCDWCARME